MITAGDLVLGALLTDPCRGALARLARLDAGRLAATLEQLRSTPDPHDFARQHAISEHWAVYMFTPCVADHSGLQPIRGHMASCLNAA